MFRFSKKIIIILAVSFLTLNFHLRSQSLDWRIVNYSIPQGLSQSAVNCILQDSRGFIWIGTQDGLNKFDGYKFTVYRHQPSDTNTLSNSYIKSMVEDQEGNIWLATRDGLNKLNPFTGFITSYFYNPYDIYSISSNEIHHLYLDRQGILWINTIESLDRFDIEAGKITRHPHFSDVFTAITGADKYFPIFEDSRGMLWVGSKDGLFYFDKDVEQFRRYEYDPANSNSISNNIIKTIIEDDTGLLWIGTENGLNSFDPNSSVFRRYYVEPLKDSRANIINEIFLDTDNFFWAATENGLFFFDPERRNFRPFQLTYMDRPYFNMEVLSVFEDSSGIYWVGTLSGVFKADSKSKFRTFRLSDYFENMPSSLDVVASIYVTNDDELWVGTWGSGLFRINRQQGGIQEFSSRMTARRRGISDDFVHAIFKDSRNRLIIGTRNGVDVLDQETGSFKSFCSLINSEACNIFRNNRVYKICEDSRGDFWFATQNGLHHFSNRKVKSYYHDPGDDNTLPSSTVREIIEGTDGVFYIGTVEGLAKLNPETGQIKTYRRKQRIDTFSISNNDITSLYEDQAGNIWIGTISGLNLFYKNTETFIVFSEKDGLPNNLIYAIEEDALGKIWVSTNKGLASINPSSWEIMRYDMADGLQNYEFNIGASFRSNSGELFFGGISGFNYFFPEFIRINKNIPNVVITSVTKISFQGETLITGDEINQIRVYPYEDAFTIEFTALDFTRPEKNNYAYKMEGIDNNWVFIGNRPFATFSKLPPGDYTFRVKGSNNDLVWNEEGTSIRVIVLTPFLKSRTAYIIYGILFIVLVYLIFLSRTSNLRKSNQILKEKEQAAIEIAKQKEELTIKNKSITDSINYAKRIQVALLPSEKLFGKIFPDSFIYYKPKDIVSGDFYWVNEKNKKVFFAVVDCTGHGVPGAFMSIIGMELLRNIINVQGIERPSDILNKLNVDFANIFSMGIDNDLTLRDGMDIGFCVIHKETGKIEFAGAFSSMYMIRDSSINEVKGNRFSVGLIQEAEANGVFQNHELQLKKNDVIYLFSDGYADQFGGQEGRKYKYRRFRHLLLNIHAMPMYQQRKQVSESIESWRGKYEQVDDMLVIGVRPDLGK